MLLEINNLCFFLKIYKYFLAEEKRLQNRSLTALHLNPSTLVILNLFQSFFQFQKMTSKKFRIQLDA